MVLLRIGVDASRLHPLTHVIKRRGLLEGLDDLIRIGTEEGKEPIPTEIGWSVTSQWTSSNG